MFRTTASSAINPNYLMEGLQNKINSNGISAAYADKFLNKVSSIAPSNIDFFNNCKVDKFPFDKIRSAVQEVMNSTSSSKKRANLATISLLIASKDCSEKSAILTKSDRALLTKLVDEAKVLFTSGKVKTEALKDFQKSLDKLKLHENRSEVFNVLLHAISPKADKVKITEYPELIKGLISNLTVNLNLKGSKIIERKTDMIQGLEETLTEEINFLLADKEQKHISSISQVKQDIETYESALNDIKQGKNNTILSIDNIRAELRNKLSERDGLKSSLTQSLNSAISKSNSMSDNLHKEKQKYNDEIQRLSSAINGLFSLNSTQDEFKEKIEPLLSKINTGVLHEDIKSDNNNIYSRKRSILNELSEQGKRILGHEVEINTSHRHYNPSSQKVFASTASSNELDRLIRNLRGCLKIKQHNSQLQAQFNLNKSLLEAKLNFIRDENNPPQKMGDVTRKINELEKINHDVLAINVGIHEVEAKLEENNDSLKACDAELAKSISKRDSYIKQEEIIQQNIGDCNNKLRGIESQLNLIHKTMDQADQHSLGDSITSADLDLDYYSDSSDS